MKTCYLPLEILMHIQEDHTHQQNIFIKSKACTSQDQQI